MEFELLGRLRVMVDGEELQLGGFRQRAVLLALVLNANRFVSRDRLIELVWGGEPPETSVGVLQTYIANLRKVLEPRRSPYLVLVSRGAGYELSCPREAIDAHRFEEGLRAGREALAAQEPARAEALFRHALDLWRGPALAEFLNEPFALGQAQRWEELRLAAIEDRIEARLALGRHEECVPDLESLVGEHPLRERLAGQLMLALYRCGRQAEASDIYQRTRARLVEATGMEPGAHLQGLLKAILSQDSALDLAPSAASQSVVGERPLPTTAGSAFVGRHPEMARLLAGLTGTCEGRGGMFLLSGEPGVGKTRMAEQLVREAEQRGAAVFWGQSTQAEGAPPYWPWVQILRSLVFDLGQSEFTRIAGPSLTQILRIVPELRSQFPEVLPAPIEDDAARFGIYDSVTQLLLRIAARRPAVLVLEDLHWADAPSLILLQLLADALPRSALMVIGTYRDRELAANHPLRTQFADFIRRGESAEIPVTGLTDAEAAGLLRALTSFEPDEDLVQRLQAQTGGNPFFLKELARSLSDEIDEPSQWRASADVLPEGVAAVLRRRIEGLSAGCRQMLEVAAVAGNMLELDVIETVTSLGRPSLLDICDEAATKGVITTQGRGYAFTHGLFRDTVYTGLLTVRRANLHRAVGAALEQRTTDSGVVSVGRLAHHFAQAALADHSLRNKARGYAVAAGNQASAELAHEEAVRLLELALAIGGSVDLREQAELLLNLGAARYLAGDLTGAVEAGSEAAELGERLRDSELLARAALVVRGVGGPGISQRIHDLCVRALRQPQEDLALRIQLHGQIAVLMGQSLDAEGEVHALQSSAEAMRLAQAASDTDVIFAAIHGRQMAISGPDGVDERLQLAQRTLNLARDSSRRSIAQWGHSWRAEALAQLGRIDEAETDLSELRRLARELHEPRLHWRTLLADSWMAILRGRFMEARSLAGEALALGRGIQRPMAEFNHNTHASVLAFFVGPGSADLDALGAYMASAAPEMVGPVMLNRAVMLAAMGRHEEARFGLRPFAELEPRNVRPRFALLPVMAAIAQVVAAVGDTELAPAVSDALLPYAEYNVATGIEFGGLWGSVARSLGMLAATLERWDDAAQRYEYAIAFESRMGAPPFVACTKVLYSEMLVRRGGADDLRYARRLASGGLATSQQLGMQPWLERAKAVLSRLDALHVAEHPLSSRELEVALLVAEGLSNRAIAERLYLSERTAEGHVKNICDKLGFNSRSQVAAWVAAKKLIQ